MFEPGLDKNPVPLSSECQRTSHDGSQIVRTSKDLRKHLRKKGFAKKSRKHSRHNISPSALLKKKTKKNSNWIRGVEVGYFTEFEKSDPEDAAMKVISLNAGGVIFKSTLLTLITCNSKVKEIFTGKHKVARLGDGSYLLDIDPDIFYYILQYFRNRHVVFDDFSDSQFIKLLHVAECLKIKPLCHGMRNYLEEDKDYSWLESVRTVPGSNIVFLISKERYWDLRNNWDIPLGYKWATMTEFAREFHRKLGEIRERNAPHDSLYPIQMPNVEEFRDFISKRLFFIFQDTAESKAFIPANKNLVICDSAHKTWRSFDESVEYILKNSMADPRVFAVTSEYMVGLAGLICLKV